MVHEFPLRQIVRKIPFRKMLQRAKKRRRCHMKPRVLDQVFDPQTFAIREGLKSQYVWYGCALYRNTLICRGMTPLFRARRANLLAE